MEQIAPRRGYHARTRCKNGPEFIVYRLEVWAGHRAAVIDFIKPGKPAQNACIESFNRTYRVEVLGLYLFSNLNEVRDFTAAWINGYNHDRLHAALSGLTPQGFAIAAT